LRRTALLAFFIVALAGCHIVKKDSYWDDAKVQKLDAEPEGLADERARFPFLGVRIPEKPGDLEIGARVLHVFGSSPASRAGLEPNDEVRSIGGAPVRSAEEVRAALRGVSPVTSIVYAREGQEHEIRVSLIRWTDYLKERKKRIFSEAAYSGTSLPFFFDYVTRELTPEFVHAYFGATVKDSVLVYEDLDIFPLNGIWSSGISVWRRETLPIYGSSRTQFICWPMRYTKDGADKTADLGESLPPPPPGTRDL
jgi:membrane-associated protease RseP (regulator of RpoE activity)